MRVYKFLSKHWALESLRARSLKIGRVTEFNDPFELFPFAAPTHVEQLAMLLTVSDLAKKYGFVCFSGGWSNPVIWAHYADQHQGICLGFDIPDESCKRVDYVPERLPFPDLPQLDAAAKFQAAQSLLFTKFSDWAYEEEVRTSIRLDPTTAVSGMYFMDFSDNLRLVEVILGLRSPTCPREIQNVFPHSPAPTLIRAMAARDGYHVAADPSPLRNHDDLVYHLKRGNVYHPVQFIP